ncbi:MAG: extracellular solute-binding protein [Rhodospirillaceae bacterium]|nr:extracellular solute-binding protein [Rhodospirillaceae bacterium]
MRLSRRHFVQGSAVAVATSMAPLSALIGPATAQEAAHGLSLFGDLKYGPDFPHFDYANPSAPKGGLLHLATVDTFSTLNPFTLKGVSAAGAGLPFESLLEGSADEADAAYGLIAESVVLAPDRRSVRFHLRPEARWHDGTPITARDVAFSYEILTTEGHPAYANNLAGVDRVETTGDHDVSFHLADPDNRKLPLIVGGLSIVSEAYYRDRAFGETTMEPPLGSGAYRVAKVDPGRSVTYERVPDYWGAQLPLNVGRYNFDTIVYDYYRDRTVLVEALKAGEYDFHEEYTSKVWATQYDIPAVEQGWLVKDVLKDNTPSGVQAFFFNTRLPKFQDRRVREALAYAFDFEWLNKNQFYGLYDRMASYFENSELAARDLPSEAELALLEPHRGAVPEEVFTKAFVPPATDGSGNNRGNLRAARSLLKEAGWVTKEGALVNGETGEPMTVEFLYFEPTFERIYAAFGRSLERLGVGVNLRLVDGAQYEERLKTHDFDITTIRFVFNLSPGAELNSYFASSTVDQVGSFNIPGIKDPVVDALIGEVAAATDRPSLIAAARALDRVLLWGHYMIPQWYKGAHHLVYWNKFDRPALKPRYARGVFDTWWVDREKDDALRAYREGGA